MAEVPRPTTKVDAFCEAQFPGSFWAASIKSLWREKASILTHKREFSAGGPLSPALSQEDQEDQLTAEDTASSEMPQESAHIPPQVTSLDLGKEDMWPAALKNTNANFAEKPDGSKPGVKIAHYTAHPN